VREQMSDEIPSATRTANEAAVLDVLRDVLAAPALGLDDDFFGEGGHSLLVIKVISELKTRHGIRLSARQFLRDPTVSAIAAACRPTDVDADVTPA
jgi:hypothetical protein